MFSSWQFPTCSLRLLFAFPCLIDFLQTPGRRHSASQFVLSNLPEVLFLTRNNHFPTPALVLPDPDSILILPYPACLISVRLDSFNWIFTR